jgi:type II secretory pathway component PulK
MNSLAGTSNRGGAVLVAALVCLLVVMGMLGTMLQGALQSHRQLRRERDLRQTELLLDAGCDRALHRLANETDYRGETWNVPADAFADKGEGRVTIEISPKDGQTARKAHVVAEYPLGDETSIRRSRTFQVLTQKPLKQE